MDGEVLTVSFLIVLGRVFDVSLGNLRILYMVQGQRLWTFCAGVLEVLIWIFCVSQVIKELDNMWYMGSYAVGFGLGSLLGMWVDDRLAVGSQMVRLFTREGELVADHLRERGHVVTSICGSGRDGPVDILMIQVRRKQVSALIDLACLIDFECYYVVDDVKKAARASKHLERPTAITQMFQKK